MTPEEQIDLEFKVIKDRCFKIIDLETKIELLKVREILLYCYIVILTIALIILLIVK